MLLTYSYRAYPTPPQIDYLNNLYGCVRTVANDYIHSNRAAHKNGEKFTNYAQASANLTLSKKTVEREWLKNASAHALQQALRNVSSGYDKFFKNLQSKKTKVGPPKFKQKHNHRQSARFVQHGETFSNFIYNNKTSGLKLPKLGTSIKYVTDRPLPSIPHNVTIVKEPSGNYYVRFVVEVEEPLVPLTNYVAGIDVGLTDLLTVVRTNGETSNRYKVPNLKHYREAQRRLAAAQRKYSHKKKGSKNREKARVRVAKYHDKVKNKRSDYLSKVVLTLVRENQTIGVETLNIKNMIKNKHLSKSISDASWGLFYAKLAYKAEQYGRLVVSADQYFASTKTCSVCGVIGESKALSVRVWECGSCHMVLDRDYNASMNLLLLAAGRVESLNACGESIRRDLASASNAILSEARTASRTLVSA